jgi:hypothetical protein
MYVAEWARRLTQYEWYGAGAVGCGKRQVGRRVSLGLKAYYIVSIAKESGG